ncbi:GspE/PulE family protein [Coraliomargarita akajimensis]|uniref:Type II secretion system protein E n=1 Tax=Coraliomargarita akajimensis (strain DSM 45221 / IAM 15411 / JCM 23193 / KCTC 12865 / 04OKA010-24) TaxID=583355 RepID=D5EPV6_CORAD|nr:GspE/PulE family protein [Coraliomargarita akajimensis]ADE55689.1 type II secretion system protein E [Coraliomargarita akajimensis DSM 45221]
MDLSALYSGLSEEQRDEIEALPRAERIAQIATLQGKATKAKVIEVAQLADIPVLSDIELVDNPTSVLPLRLIHEYQCLPVHTGTAELDETPEDDDSVPNADGPLQLVTLWPPDETMNRWIYAVCGRPAEWHLGDPELVSNTITQRFGVGADSLDESDIIIDEAEQEEDEDEDAAVIRFVNEVVQKAVSDRATDIHFEPHRDELQIRYRIDGELVPIRVPDNLIKFQSAIISRLKIMAKLNISEKRRPQDGRISFGAGDAELDIRISTFPTMYGESVSLRLLNQKSKPLSMRELGLAADEEQKLERALAAPHGIILVTGPTGSGKSTSLTAYIRLINKPERRIITVEDPVEYEVPGVNQTQVHPEIGLTFAQSLRAVLRQDPDVIMVGEIRDRETADIAIRASLTGHLVLSTLHTNDAPGALTRLTDMDIEPFLIASSVELIVAQRLVRRLCPNCAQPASYEAAQIDGFLATMRLDPSEAKHAHLAKQACGCERCRKLGFRGRVGIFEILRMSDEIHEHIVKRDSARLIRQTAVSQGMRSLQESGWEHIKNGTTTFEEVMRFAELEDVEE